MFFAKIALANLGAGLMAFSMLSHIHAPLSADAAAYQADTLTHRVLNLNKVIEPLRKQMQLPALGVAITSGERLLATGVTGVRIWGKKDPAQPNDAFHLGSDTKAMTATLAGLLIQQGKLHWNTTLAQALPMYAKVMQPAYRKLTIEQLMQQRTGFSADTALPSVNMLQLHQLPGSPTQQRAAYVKAVLQEKPVNAPGTTFLYSNRNYAVLGFIEETVAGISWEQLMQTDLFEPLGMTTAGYGPMASTRKQGLWEHIVSHGHHVAIPPGPLADNPVCIAPAALVHCSITDWAKFAALHLRGEEGKNGLLNAHILQRLHTPLPGSSYADGWLTLPGAAHEKPVLTHDGSNTLNYCSIWLYPQHDIAIMVAFNQGIDDKGLADATAMAQKLVVTLMQYWRTHQNNR